MTTDPRTAPLRVLSQPLLGDPLMLMSEPPDHQTGRSALSQLELRVALLEGLVAELQAQVVQLEQQTPRAYWQRLVRWLRSLWP